MTPAEVPPYIQTSTLSVFFLQLTKSISDIIAPPTDLNVSYIYRFLYYSSHFITSISTAPFISREEDADIETKLEKIITQKWLACWPESYEAWAEQRRTGYPKLFKVQSNTGKVIDTDIMIRRLPFSTDAATADPAQYATLTEKLGGADNGATRLWWDTGKNSF